MLAPPSAFRHQQRLLGATLIWLLAGSLLLLSTLVPAHDNLLGWTPAFWLVGAPLIVLLGLEPTLPWQLLALRRTRRHALHAVVWH